MRNDFLDDDDMNVLGGEGDEDAEFWFNEAARKARRNQVGTVVFFHYERKLCFTFALPHKSKLDGRAFALCVNKLVPPRHLKDEPVALKAFLTKQSCRKIQAFARELDKADAFQLHPDIPLEIKVKDVAVAGMVVRADGRVLRVRMTSPYQGECVVNYGFASSMSGRHMLSYNAEGVLSLSLDGMKSALGLLKQAYSEAMRAREERPLQKLVARLNGS